MENNWFNILRIYAHEHGSVIYVPMKYIVIIIQAFKIFVGRKGLKEIIGSFEEIFQCRVQFSFQSAIMGDRVSIEVENFRLV